MKIVVMKHCKSPIEIELEVYVSTLIQIYCKSAIQIELGTKYAHFDAFFYNYILHKNAICNP